MEARLSSQITGFVAAAVPLMTLLAYAVGGRATAVAALAGGAVSVLNWAVLRWVTGRIVHGSLEQKSGLMLLLVLKMGALMGVCYLLIAKLGLEPVGFVMGLGALVIGILVGSALAARVPISKEG